MLYFEALLRFILITVRDRVGFFPLRVLSENGDWTSCETILMDLWLPAAENQQTGISPLCCFFFFFKRSYTQLHKKVKNIFLPELQRDAK